MPNRYCGNCGSDLSPEDRFCRSCGTPVQQAATVPTPEADVPVPPPPSSRQVGDLPTPPGGRSTDTTPPEWWQTRTGWAVAAYVLVAALLFGVSERFFPQLTVVALVVTIPGALVVCAYVLYQVFVLAREGPPTDRRSRTQQGHRTRREPIPRSVKMYVWQRDGGRCVECGSRERLEYDHIIPLSEGGSNTDRNIQLLCERCNRRKGARII